VNILTDGKGKKKPNSANIIWVNESFEKGEKEKKDGKRKTEQG
jgi:hypothetical protein